MTDSADGPPSTRLPRACPSRNWSRCWFAITATCSGHTTTPVGTRVTWSPATANEPERSADRAQQRAVEGRMPLGDVGRVGHGDAVEFHLPSRVVWNRETPHLGPHFAEAWIDRDPSGFLRELPSDHPVA